jgi:hypothetical protein
MTFLCLLIVLKKLNPQHGTILFRNFSQTNQSMKKNFPIHFTLEDGTHVVVNHTPDHTYDFTLRPDDGQESHFSYRDNETFTPEMENELDFDQLNALRRFWLEQEKEELT